MEVKIKSVTGIEDAIISLFISKRNFTSDKEKHIREVCNNVLNRNGRIKDSAPKEDLDEFNSWMKVLLKWGRHHITMLKFINFSVVVRGLHRGGQDDWDSHAKRFDNRIIRASTRLADFGNEKSAYYQDKILTVEDALNLMGVTLPPKITYDDVTYVKRTNGYIKEEYADNKDVKRGLYMLSIPSDFIFAINLAEWGHLYKERNKNTSANPEVKELCERIADQLETFQPAFTRELALEIKN